MSKKQPTSDVGDGLKSLLGVEEPAEELAPGAEVEDEQPAKETVLERQARLALAREEAGRLLRLGTADLRVEDDVEELQQLVFEAEKRANEAVELANAAEKDRVLAQAALDKLRMRLKKADTRTDAELNKAYLDKVNRERFEKAAIIQAQQRALIDQGILTPTQISQLGAGLRSPVDQAISKRVAEARQKGLR
jgi:hypothetical protein